MKYLHKIIIILFLISCKENKTNVRYLSLVVANKLDILDTQYTLEKDSLYKEYILKTNWCVYSIVSKGDTINIKLEALRPKRMGKYKTIKNIFPSLYEDYIQLTFIGDKFITTESGTPNFYQVNFNKIVYDNIDIVSDQKKDIFLNKAIFECNCSRFP